MPTHLEAKQITDALGLTPAESLFVRLVALSEGGGTYGRGWKISPQPINWGAMTAGAEWLGSTFSYVDHDATGKSYVTKFRNYPDDESAARGLSNLLLKTNVRDALARGDLWGAVSAQINDNHYTGYPPATPAVTYYDRVAHWLPVVLNTTGEPSPFLSAHPTPNVTGTGSASLLLASRSLLRTCADVGALAVLRRDTAGADVAFLQYVLGGLKIDGWFGPLTEAAVREYQRSRKLVVDGIVGPQTWGAMKT